MVDAELPAWGAVAAHARILVGAERDEPIYFTDLRFGTHHVQAGPVTDLVGLILLEAARRGGRPMNLPWKDPIALTDVVLHTAAGYLSADADAKRLLLDRPRPAGMPTSAWEGLIEEASSGRSRRWFPWCILAREIVDEHARACPVPDGEGRLDRPTVGDALAHAGGYQLPDHHIPSAAEPVAVPTVDPANEAAFDKVNRTIAEFADASAGGAWGRAVRAAAGAITGRLSLLFDPHDHIDGQPFATFQTLALGTFLTSVEEEIEPDQIRQEHFTIHRTNGTGLEHHWQWRLAEARHDGESPYDPVWRNWLPLLDDLGPDYPRMLQSQREEADADAFLIFGTRLQHALDTITSLRGRAALWPDGVLAAAVPVTS